MEQPFITGKIIYLRGLGREDLPDVVKWINNPEVTHYLFMGDKPSNLESLTESWEKELRSPNDISFAIVDMKKDELIGWTGIYTINWISRSAEYRVFIGNKNYWSKGIGTEAARLLIEYAFNKLNLNRVWLGVNAEHKGALKSYGKAGFIKEGVLRQELFRNGKYYDVIRMGILKS
ncbi:MAG: GNAT family protein [Candidatus Omnitrophota bacterium]